MKNWLLVLIALPFFIQTLCASDSPPKNVLVAGGAGFLGTHLCEKLLSDGCNVICLDNLLTGRIKNIEHLRNLPNFTFVQQDIIQLTDLGVPLDEIYNLACAASPPHYQEDPIHTIMTNVVGSNNLLELARKYNAKIFLASTSEIYGDPLEHPQNENYRGNVNPDGPRACYDEGKRCAESLFFDYHRTYGVNIKVARIFNTYGPGMDPKDGRVISNMIMQAINDLPITVYGDGSQTRSFCYVSDTIEGFVALMNSEDGFTGPVNIGNPFEFTILELATLLVEKTNSKSKIIYESLPVDDPKKRLPNITLAKEKLDWTPKITLNEGLDLTIQYFRNECQNETDLLIPTNLNLEPA